MLATFSGKLEDTRTVVIPTRETAKFVQPCEGANVMLNQAPHNVGRYLTSEETIELARIQQDNSVIGYALLTLEGDEIESGGAWSSMLGPVFSNIVVLADRIGEEFGEQEICPMLLMESPDFEVAGVLLSSARAIIIKRKPKRKAEGLRSVG